MNLEKLTTLPYLINVHGRLLFSEKISRVLLDGGRLLIFWQNSRVDVYSNVDAY